MISVAKTSNGWLAILALLTLMFMLMGTAYGVAGLRHSEEWTRHATVVELELARLQGALIDGEAGQRGYLATGDTTFLEPYTRAIGVWRESFDKVRALTIDNPSQQQRLTDLEPLILHKLDDLKSGIDLRRDAGAAASVLLPTMLEGKRTMDLIRDAIADMQREEGLLGTQRADDAVRRGQALFLLLSAAGAIVLIAAAAVWAARARQEQLALANAALDATAKLERSLRVRREFLAKSGEVLASSLDYKTTLAATANLAVPTLADWCSVELVEPGATAPVQVAIAHADPSKIRFVREIGERYPPDPNARTGAPEVIRSGKSALYKEIPAALLEAGARDSEHLRILRELRLESGMIVPLKGRERVLGAMSFVYANSGRHYTEDDLAFAEDFARRATMAIENALAHASVSSLLLFQERFVAVLGHDLRNPLAAIDMAQGLLSKRAETANDAAATRILARIQSSSRRMSRMVEQILDLARSRLGGGLEMKPAEMDMCAMLTEIVNEVRTSHPSRTIVLRCSPLLGTWDRDRLEQVFSNLIGNAIHHGDAETPVDIEARQEGAEVHVEVHNHGVPIPEELRSQLFSPFRRGTKDSRTSKTAGLGLGLYIAERIVAAHGGALEVESTAADGTTFIVKLPRTTPPLQS
jgi:signal transduction histidine kinase/CHASE3 domain sensor protein